MPGYQVRCPRCDRASADDAAWCSSCGAALAGEVLPLGVAPEGGPAAPEPAATSPRHRWRAAAVAAAVALGGAVVVAAPWDGEEPAPSPATTTTSTTASTAGLPSTTTTAIPPVFLPEQTGGVRLLLARAGAVDLVDLDANTITTHPVEGLSPRPDDSRYFASPVVVRRGDHLVFQSGETTSAVPLNFSAPPRPLGPSVLFLASVAEDRVWLVSRAGDGAPSVREVDLGGRPAGAAATLPPDWTPRAAVQGGLVLIRNGRFQVWDPATGQVRFSSEDGVDVLASGGRLVAWRYYCDGPFCPIHLTDVVTGRDTVVYPDAIPSGAGAGAFSPDGRTLAFSAQLAVPDPRSGTAPAVGFVDVESGRASFASSVADFGLFTWSASGRWVFSAGPGGGPGSVLAFRPGLDVGLAVDLGPRRGAAEVVAW